MKHIIILGDGMADHAVDRLGGKTLLQYADTPYMDMLARKGRTGRLTTIPEGYLPGSEVANSTILGYDQDKVYEGRGPLEAASIGYDLHPDDFALRCNIIELEDGLIKNHHGGHLKTEEADVLLHYLNDHLGNERVRFVTGIQYRHLLVVRGGNKHVVCAPPHDHPNEPWADLMVKPEEGWADRKDLSHGAADGLTGQQTADLLNDLILKSQQLLAVHPFNQQRAAKANSIWPWGGGYRPSMQTLQQLYPQIHTGSCISAVDLIRGIGRYAGLDVVKVPGATGLADTNYEGKAEAALKALAQQDFVFLHLEASDEAGHDGNIPLKLQTIENLDHRLLAPILAHADTMEEPLSIALLPDHPTPCELRTHTAEPIPFCIWHKGIEPDAVQTFDEDAATQGALGLLEGDEFIHTFMRI